MKHWVTARQSHKNTRLQLEYQDLEVYIKTNQASRPAAFAGFVMVLQERMLKLAMVQQLET